MASVSNMEEAATIASEYVASLENLPNEVQFLLAELRVTDVRLQELQREIDKDSAKYFKQQLRGAANGGGAKDNIPAKIAADYTTLSLLTDDKRALADRLAVLITRSRARLDHDLQRMFTLTGEDPALRTNYPSLSLSGPTPMTAVVDHLRESLTLVDSVSASSLPPTKRRRTAAVATPNRASPAPVGVSIARSSRAQASPAVARGRRGATVSDIVSEEEEGAEGQEEDAEEEDNTIYCICQQKSHGEMIGCDNKSCKYQWFHLACVNIAEGSELPKTWYCKECLAARLQPKSRKGRKK